MYSKCFSTLICCGWAYGAIIIVLSPQVLAQVGNIISRNPDGSLVGLQTVPFCKQWGFRPTQMDSTSVTAIWKVFDNLHMQWMGIWSHHHCVITTGASPGLGKQQKSWVMVGLQTVPFCKQWGFIPPQSGLAHPWQTYAMCLTIIICNGWEYYRSIIILLSPQI